jgi:hypothetical protein
MQCCERDVINTYQKIGETTEIQVTTDKVRKEYM